MAQSQQALEELKEQLKGVNPSSTSTTRYNKFRQWISETFGSPFDLTYISTVSGASKNLGVRFRQANAATANQWELGVAVTRLASELPQLIRAAKKAVGPARPALLKALIVCVRPDDGDPYVAALVEPEHGRYEETFRLLFPDAAVERPEPMSGEVTLPPPRPPLPPGQILSDEDVEELAAQLGAELSWVQDVRWGLQTKQAIVFYGPPGTGKTFIARALAERIQPDVERRAFLQLHPSYGYEEFFEGYRPSPAENGLSLTKQSGPLRRLVDLAEEDPSQPVILVLDEMNRGNLPKVFGELYFLLEYRDASVSLMYSPDEDFRLPPNLYIVGAMNTADRSIVLLDQALRRRFLFMGLFPGQPPVRDMLPRYLDRHVPHMAWTARLLDLVNTKLGDRNIAIGPSYFMRPDLSDSVLQLVWKYSILPTLEDLLSGEPERLAEFSLERLTDELNRPTT
ncbi:AAA family ATPase [Myxococcus sp. XM-1-1-1]|uniref:McrB family protein n=1 Tax=Myxococcus sp. XM-1-1-1 TaxID=2874602 RepID=UPI001CBA8A95|nr:AAA family ATPase [Myxococcus sp. XM-1-1-1]MBZ4411241.1 AAA family ATPase [Myxococcus sp. XM-1-1-1]